MFRPVQLLKDGAKTVLFLLLFFCICLLLQVLSTSESLVSLVLVLAVFLISLVTQGYLWGVVASLVCVLLDNYVFAAPYLAFNFLDTENLISASVFLAVAILSCTLTTKLKKQERIKAEAELEAMRSNLLRAVSHDLRTPLTTIYGSCSLLLENREQLSPERQTALLRDMQSDCDDLIRMVENLLSVTRVNGGGVCLKKTPTVLEELVDSVLMHFHKRHPRQQVLVEIPDDFISIPMDAMLMEQVLINLLENSVYHAAGMTALGLRVTPRGNKAVFEIWDDGCGIPKDQLEHLFTGCSHRTSQADGMHRGMGIGLSVCAAIIKAHGSEISAENRPGGGAVFRFCLEMEESDDEQQ